ncbi:hypothetical protein NC651_013331 [Populus alba x Populus x berolinensis]|nr:hypothetical protein NC651_013331 [Populus alba x Populus x berolinensis]
MVTARNGNDSSSDWKLKKERIQKGRKWLLKFLFKGALHALLLKEDMENPHGSVA